MDAAELPMGTAWKRPLSVLVVIHTVDLQVLLLERASHPGFWQSVTGSHEGDEPLVGTAVRELAEETGIIADHQRIADWGIVNTYEIFPEWRHRYAPGTILNVEHVFSLELAEPVPITVSPTEHLTHIWLPWQEAAARVFSWSNRDAILMLPHRRRPD